MKKKEFCRELAKKTGMYIYQVEDIMSAFQDTLADVMKNGDKLFLHGFGTFKPVEREERMVKTIFADKPVCSPACTNINFKASDELFRKVNGRERRTNHFEDEKE